MESFRKEPTHRYNFDDVLAKGHIHKYFAQDFLKTSNYFRDNEEPMVMARDPENRYNQCDIALTSCYVSNIIFGTTVLFGLPPQLLHMEDIVLNTPLSELQRALAESAKHLLNELARSEADPYTSDKRLMRLLRVFGMEKFPELLYEFFYEQISCLLRKYDRECPVDL